VKTPSEIVIILSILHPTIIIPMCIYENVTERFASCGHDICGFGPMTKQCPKYIKRLARFREADRKWREGSQERCPPTPFNMFSCSERDIASKRVLINVPGLCWKCVHQARQSETRVRVRDWAELREASYRGVTPESDAGTSFGGGYETDGMLPLSPPASTSSEGDEIDDRFGPHIVIPERCTDYPRTATSPVAKESHPPRRSQRIVEQQVRKGSASETTTASTRGRTRKRE